MGTETNTQSGSLQRAGRGQLSTILVVSAAVCGIVALGALAAGVGSAVAMGGERDAVASELVALRAETADARKAKAAADEAMVSAKSELASLTARAEEAQKQQLAAEKVLEAARTELADAATQAATARELGRDVDERRERLKQLEAEVQKAEGTRAANAKSIAEQEAAIAANLARVTTASQKLADAESTIRRAADQAAELVSRQSEISKIGADVATAKAELASLRAQAETVRAELDTAETKRIRLQALDTEIQEKERKAGEISAQLKLAQVDQDSLASLRSDREQLQREVDSLKASKIQAEQAVKALAASEALAKQLEDAFVRIGRALDQISARAGAPGAGSAVDGAKPSDGGRP